MITELPTNLYKKSYLTGSSYICDPPVLNTDVDYIIYTETQTELFYYLVDTGWSLCGNAEYEGQGEFTAYRKGKFNYIITSNLVYYLRYCAATELAKKLNLLNKADRVELFNWIVTGRQNYGT